MKNPTIHILTLLFLYFITTSSIFSQSNLLEKKISIKFNNKSLGDVLEKIAEEGNFNFSYSNTLIPVDKKINLKIKKTSIKNILDILLNGLNVEYLVIENQVIIKKSDVEISTNLSLQNKNKFTISGFIKDKETGEVLIGSTIKVLELKKGTVTNAYGFYSLTLLEGDYTIIYSYIGYKSYIQHLQLNSNRKISVEMDFAEKIMDEIVVDASEKSENIIENSQMSEMKITSQSFKEMPTSMGETDIIKCLQSIPGIKMFGDGSTFFYVRGGNRDQNMILIDEAPIYNPSHMLGFFSTFIPEAVNDVKIYKGDFPSSYGGRLSSYIDIKTKEGNQKQIEGSGSIGLIANRISLEGPIIKDKGSYFVSYRRSHVNFFIHQFNNPNLNLVFDDLNIKLNQKITDKDRLFISGYYGSDMYNIAYGIGWKNAAGTFRWNHLFSDKLFCNTTFYTSKYDYYFYFDSKKLDEYWNNYIANISLKSDLTYYLSPDYTIWMGFQVNNHYFNPGNIQLKEEDYLIVPFRQAYERSFYVSNEKKFSKLAIRFGVRFPYWLNKGETKEFYFDNNYEPIDTLSYPKDSIYHWFFNAEPRIAINYIINKETSLKVSYSRTFQFVQWLSNSISPFTSLEVWMPSGPNIPPQKSDLFVLGIFRRIPERKIDLSIECFYKKMGNQIEYADHASMFLNTMIESELRFGDVWSYGTELLLRKHIGKLDGWIGYTLSRAWRKTININHNEKYPAFYDRPHDLTIFISYAASKRFNFSCNWIYATGSAITTPTGFYYYHGYSIPIYSHKNNDRLPDYHRLDLLATLRLNPNQKKGYQHNLTFSVFNIYARKNPVMINFNKVISEDNKYKIPSNMMYKSDIIPTQLYLLGTIIPSITYNFKF